MSCAATTTIREAADTLVEALKIATEHSIGTTRWFPTWNLDKDREAVFLQQEKHMALVPIFDWWAIQTALVEYQLACRAAVAAVGPGEEPAQ